MSVPAYFSETMAEYSISRLDPIDTRAETITDEATDSTNNNSKNHSFEKQLPSASTETADANVKIEPAVSVKNKPAFSGGGARQPGTGRRSRRARAAHPARPSAIDNINIGQLMDLPVGVRLETPLHPKRRRSHYSITSMPSSPAASDSALPPPSQPTTPPRSPLSPASPFHRPAPSESSSPSPTALFVECLESERSTPGVSDNYDRMGTDQPDAHWITLDEFLGTNYGSEEDTDDEADQRVFVDHVPRYVRALLEPPSDEEKEREVVASKLVLTEWPNSATIVPPSPTPVLNADPAPLIPPTPVIYRPESMFEFEWRSLPSPPIPCEQRREQFSGIGCGPTAPLDTPYDAFVAIWDRPIMEHIAAETNKYAQQLTKQRLAVGNLGPRSRLSSWKDTDVDEMYVFFAVILATGVVVKSRLEDYWSVKEDIFSTPGFSAGMSLRRFKLLNRCLHFNDNAAFHLGALSRPDVMLFKVKPVVDHLNGKFSRLYNLGQNLALDESLTQRKGWLDIDQFLPKKAAQAGIKTFEVCESQTGYLWRFEVYAGRVASPMLEDHPLSGTVASTVLRLLEGLEHKGHTLWMDSYFHSPALARHLKVLGFDCVGTLRTGRRFVPAELSALKTNMAIGEVRGCTSGDIDLVVWRDSRRVALISTYHGFAVTTCDGVSKPTVVHDYNVRMGGMDKRDRLLAAYPLERKRAKVWYKKLFRRLLNVSATNAYVLLERSTNPVSPAEEHRRFRETLVRGLLERHCERTARVAPAAQAPGALHSPCSLLQLYGKSLRRLCWVCKRKVSTACHACGVVMCALPCFHDYHVRVLNL